MPLHQARTARRRGFSYLETQVALVLFMLAISGLVPLTVIQSRQMAAIESRFEPSTTNYLVPAEGNWAKKLGAPAVMMSVPPGPPPPVPEHYAPITIDDRDKGYAERNRETNDWYRYNDAKAYGGDFTLNYPDDVNDRAIWEFKNLSPGKYEVYVTYPRFNFTNKDAEYEFFINGKDKGDKDVDQRKPLPAPKIDGVFWKKLKSLEVEDPKSTIRVLLSDEDAKGYNVIDAMRLVPEAPDMYLHNLKKPLTENYMEVMVHVEHPDDDDDD